jgi:hypothetical protein
MSIMRDESQNAGSLAGARLRTAVVGALSLALTAAMMSACGFPEYGFVGEGGSGAAGGGPTGGSGAGPACDGDDDCAATPATPVCNGALGACVECVAGGNTCQLGEYCASGNTCEPGCDADEDCNLGGEGGGAGLPALTCDVPTNQCIGCVIVDGVDSCPEGTVCDNGACVLPCEVGYGNCNDDPGCETLLTTLSNCGVCGAECTNFHGATECVDAACLPTCDEYYQDCDANPNNGCETSLETAASCGGCTSPCDFPNAEDLCPQGTCTLGLCDDGFGNCDGNDANGCETDTNSSSPHCGGCDLPCAPGDFCVDGGCQSACPDPTANCDMSALNGCEVNTDTDGLHCGDCSTVCSAAQTCATGTCAACAGATRDCDDDGANGCEGQHVERRGQLRRVRYHLRLRWHLRVRLCCVLGWGDLPLRGLLRQLAWLAARDRVADRPRDSEHRPRAGLPRPGGRSHALVRQRGRRRRNRRATTRSRSTTTIT